MLTERLHSFLIIILLTLAIAACGLGGGSGGGQGNAPSNGNETLDKSGQVFSVEQILKETPFTLEHLKILHNFYKPYNGLGSIPPDNIQYTIKVHKVVYWTTDATAQPVKASGLLVLPDTSTGNKPSIINYHHGTIFDNSHAPTNQAFYQDTGAIIAAMNNIVMMPDYVGYGESNSSFHPYMHAERLATSSVDFLTAVTSILSQESILTDGKLYLTGYSEGAYAALATHKMIQEKYSDQFSVTATLAGSGAYDLSTTATDALMADTLASGANVTYLYKAYDTIYGYNRVDSVLKEPYAGYTDTYFDGSQTDSKVDSTFSKITAELFQETFLNDFRTDGETTIKQHLVDNSIHDWKPTSRVRLFYGVYDKVVPPKNAEATWSNMVARGAVSNVELVNCNTVPELDANHINCMPLYLYDMVTFILDSQ
ncbi:MAG: prolyl oligopeptidase family serine peptidase [Gammaproteobacteria bacterium]|nr:prolyl oligopeptidase family serine peptidase [Gammaproteobacteria bacterium]